jgi:hypothetical protein
MRYLVYTPKFGLWHPKGSTFDLIGYYDADYAGCKIDRKSTSGTWQILGRSLVSWASKKQNSEALSTAKAGYIAAGYCCAQLLWMRQTLRDYGYKLSKVPLLCDNESAIRMADNSVEHSRTKHIDIRYHFLRDHQQRGDIKIAYVSIHNQLANIFNKSLDEKTYSKLRNELNILDSRNFDWNLAHIAHFIPLILACLFYLVQMHISYSFCAKAKTNVLPRVFLYLVLNWQGNGVVGNGKASAPYSLVSFDLLMYLLSYLFKDLSISLFLALNAKGEKLIGQTKGPHHHPVFWKKNCICKNPLDS